MIRDGYENWEIAPKLGISIHTVDSHRRNLTEKVDAHNAVQLVMRCLRAGFIQLWD